LYTPPIGSEQQDFFHAFAAEEFAGGEQIDAGDFQLGRGDRA